MTRRPVQIYLEPRDRVLLEQLAERLRLSMAETVREAVRRWARDLSGEGDGVLSLIGSADAPGVPVDLSTRHDEYAVRGYPAARVAERPAGGRGRAGK